MDFKNKSISLENITSFDVNKSIQRSLTKAVARHGLGLYIYAGEDLPEEEAKKRTKAKKAANKTAMSMRAAEKAMQKHNFNNYVKGISKKTH